MYVQLRTFREQNGHLRVSKKLKPKLGAWIDYQRVLYRQRQECCKEGDRATAPTAAASSMSITDHRVELLERIGFDWNYSPPTVTGENNFSNRDKPRLLDSSTSTSTGTGTRQDCAGKRLASPLEMLSSVAVAEHKHNHKHKHKQPRSHNSHRSSMGPVKKQWVVPFRPITGVQEYPSRMPSPTSTAYFPPVPSAASRVLPSQGYVMSCYHPPVPAHAYSHAHGPAHAYPMISHGSGQQRSTMSHNFYYPSRNMFRQKK